jgi:hypothetical protein
VPAYLCWRRRTDAGETSSNHVSDGIPTGAAHTDDHDAGFCGQQVAHLTSLATIFLLRGALRIVSDIYRRAPRQLFYKRGRLASDGQSRPVRHHRYAVIDSSSAEDTV